MVFNNIFKKFIEKSPFNVMLQALMENLFTEKKLNDSFEESKETQYTREVLFSTVFEMMTLVVCGNRKSISEAFKKSESSIPVSLVSIYNKLKGLSPNVSVKILRDSVKQMEGLIKRVNGERQALLPGFRVKMLDGNCIEATQHRLNVLKKVGAGALPGKSLVVYDPALGLAIDLFPCEDGHAQERSLMPDVLESVCENDLWIADRNFCTRSTLLSIDSRGAAFVIRQHGILPFKEMSKFKYKGKNLSGKIYEQKIQIDDNSGQSILIRRVKIVLNEAIRAGKTELYILTNLKSKVASGKLVAELYKKRWKIETSFQELEKNLYSEINTLGYPKAALFGFSVALITQNIMAMIMATMRGVHGEEKMDEELSSYYIATDIEVIQKGMMIATSDSDWIKVSKMNYKSLSELLVLCAKNVRLTAYKKNKRGPKKPPPERVFCKKHPHVSTKKLLDLERKKKKVYSHI